LADILNSSENTVIQGLDVSEVAPKINKSSKKSHLQTLKVWGLLKNMRKSSSSKVVFKLKLLWCLD